MGQSFCPFPVVMPRKMQGVIAPLPQILTFSKILFWSENLKITKRALEITILRNSEAKMSSLSDRACLYVVRRSLRQRAAGRISLHLSTWSLGHSLRARSRLLQCPAAAVSARRSLSGRSGRCVPVRLPPRLLWTTLPVYCGQRRSLVFTAC